MGPGGCARGCGNELSQDHALSALAKKKFVSALGAPLPDPPPFATHTPLREGPTPTLTAP
jgi:hypothetical protein